MKTFDDLIKEVQEPGLCHHCGGCVTFCTAINFAALTLDNSGRPQYADKEKCIECGICHSICPEIDELDDETKKNIGWVPPMGKVIETSIARSVDATVRNKATDGGVVTGLLLHLLNTGHIDGAIVTRPKGPFQREPALVTTPEEIMDAAGFSFDTSHGMHQLGEGYSTYSSSFEVFRPMQKKGLHRVALVGTPCQIKTIRKIEALGIVPSDSIKYCFGLFCSGNFKFDEAEKAKLEQLGGFQWNDMKKINVKEQLMVHLTNKQIKAIPLNDLDFMKRYACRFCQDYAAEFADISFGGIGSQEGWTTVITRSALGRAIFADAKEVALEVYDQQKNPQSITEATEMIQKASDAKKKKADENRNKLKK